MLNLIKLQKKNDELKNNLCEVEKFPFLRINSNHILKKFGDTVLLDWMVEIWFLREAFFDAQESGIVSMDELFDPDAILYESGNKKHNPYDFVYDLQAKINLAFKEGKIYHNHPNIWIGVDKNDNYHGMAYILVTPRKCIIAQSGVKKTTFPINECDLLEKLLMYELYDKFLSGNFNASTLIEIDYIYKDFESKYELVLCSGFSLGDNDL